MTTRGATSGSATRRRARIRKPYRTPVLTRESAQPAEDEDRDGGGETGEGRPPG
jgi:hypothetical protein